MALTPGWTDAEAVARTPALVQRAGGVAFGLARELSRAADDLSRALAAEVRAEQVDHEAERQAVLAQATLLAAVRPRVEPADCAVYRGKVAVLLEKWTDPYAADAAGRPLLDAARAKARAADGLDDLRGALDQMRASGLARDRAAVHRARAIAERVTARQSWDRAHASLREAAGLPPAAGAPPEPDLSDWFTEALDS